MATKINSFAISSLTKGAHSDFHTRVNNLITALGAEELHLEAIAQQYAEAVAVEASIVYRQTTFVATAKMKEADKMRDSILSTINAVVNAHQYNPIATKHEAYVALQALIAPFKGIRDHEYSRETSEVTALLAELQTVIPHIATLGLAEEVAELQKANAAFSAEFDAKTMEAAERAPKSDIDTATARRQCDTLYKQICDLANAYALIQPTEAINTFVQQMNGIIETFDAIAQQPRYSSKGEVTPETEGGEGTEGGNEPTENA